MFFISSLYVASIGDEKGFIGERPCQIIAPTSWGQTAMSKIVLICSAMMMSKLSGSQQLVDGRDQIAAVDGAAPAELGLAGWSELFEGGEQ